MIALAFVLLCQVAQVQEQEPNDTRETAHQEVVPGGALAGTLPDGDHDWVWIACEADTVCSLVLEIAADETASFEVACPEGVFSVRTNDRPVRALRLRFPKGRTPVHVTGAAKQYVLRVTPVIPGPHEEVEPNERDEDAIEIRLGETWRGWYSGANGEMDFYRLRVTAPGPCELVVKRDRQLESPVRAMLRVYPQGAARIPYSYGIEPVADEFHFYPVLTAGTWILQFQLFGDTGTDRAYDFAMLPFLAKVTAEELAAGAAAVERATSWLLQLPESRSPADNVIAAESMVLAALAEGRGARERREQLERDYVAWLAPHFTKLDGGPWRGHDVFSCTTNIYTHAMATLGLAEAAANGCEQARTLATRGVEFLLATQNTLQKPAQWKGPVPKQAQGYGGWRYVPDDPMADLSIVGWCLVALTAADAAGIRIDGMREAAAATFVFVDKVGNENGFGYNDAGSRANVHNSIGALLELLYDERSKGFAFAASELDAHLWAATQVDTADQYPFYYLYYGTRAQYLRHGDAWQNWRAVALRQLLRRQQADGSWAAIEGEQQPGPRWVTALGLMALRLCLDEPPRYLRLEVKGF